LPFPTGKATSRYREVRACTQRVFANGCLPRSLRLRVAEKRFVGQLHLLPGTLHPQRNFWKQSNYPRKETLIPRVVALERNDLSGFNYSRANKQMFTGLCGLGIDPSWLLSSCLTSASLRSVRIPANRDVRLRYLEGKRRP
jgi:hypothetical protein